MSGLEAHLDCRCGLTIVGRAAAEEDESHGEVTRCGKCGIWSHIACQRYGRASNLHPSKSFDCDGCDPELPSRILRGANAESNRAMVASLRTEHQTTELENRLRSGRGALAKHGEYHYPVRLIRKVSEGWVVRWWRENQFSTPPDATSTVHPHKIVDSLWSDATARRQIRLGKWIHACQAASVEDVLANPSSIPYTDIINRALSPHKHIFLKLSVYDLDMEDTLVPVKVWMQSVNKPPRSTPVYFVGCLSVTQRAQIANWFDRHITLQDPTRRLDWLARMPIAHAYTVYIAFLLSQDKPTTKLTETQLIQKAWEIQVQGKKSLDVDVDAECLSDLELDMFEVSAQASTAGYYQWGLDAGHHQDNWYPYSGLPEAWRKDCCIINDDDECLQRGPSYIQYTSRVDCSNATTLRPRPRPRVLGSTRNDVKIPQ